MWCGLISIFPTMFEALTTYGITARAFKRGLLELDIVDLRDFANNAHAQVDDKPYGGGPGMVLKPEPLLGAIAHLKARAPQEQNVRVIYLSPQGRTVHQQMLQAAVDAEYNFIFIVGRYEGIDERIIELAVDEEWSIGDYIVTGGELPAMLVIDAMTRLLPGAVNNHQAIVQESFVDGLLDYPHYTRPESFAGKRVPDVLLSGNHKEIAKWRADQQVRRTALKKPELLTCKKLYNE